MWLQTVTYFRALYRMFLKFPYVPITPGLRQHLCCFPVPTQHANIMWYMGMYVRTYVCVCV